MKKLLIPLLILTGLTASARTFVARADLGYLLDSEEAYSTASVGWQLKAGDTSAQFLEAEIGYTKATQAGGSANLVPLTLNYRLEAATRGNFGYYVGAGAGSARTRVQGVGIGGPVRLSDTSFAAQGFAGVTYRLSPAATLSLGAKYLWIDDVRLAGTNFKVGDDVALSAGLSFRF